VESVRSPAALVLILGQGVGRMMGKGDPAGAEDQIDPPLGIDGADDAGWEFRARIGPAGFSVERDSVLVGRPRFQPIDADQRVVVSLDTKGVRAIVEHLNLAG
jgi:hypothetical protein